MKNVRLDFLLILSLVFSFSYQGYADCPWNAKSNTELESFFGGWEEWRKKISVIAVKNQEVDGYFNPKIKVCGADGGKEYPEYCHELYSGTSCKKIYGTQNTGAGISAMVFIDWEGDKTKIGKEFAKGLGWEWADGVTDEEKVKFANSPKICACSQKGTCMSGVSSWSTKAFSGANIFRPGEMENVCDTCYQRKIKCAPVPLAPGPPSFCEQLAMSPPQVRIVPIRDQENDYFNPRVKVIIGKLTQNLYFERAAQAVEDGKGTTYYFETYRRNDELCTEYHGTEKEKSKRKLQFPARCFPAPSTPKIEIVKVVDEDTLEVKIKMGKETCKNYRYYDNGFCTLNISINHSTNIGPLSLKVVKPAIIKKTSIKQNDKVLEKILNHIQPFSILEQHGYAPSITAECKAFNKQGQCRLDNLGRPEIEVKYKDNPKSKMLCISGWQPEPEESVLKRESEIIQLKSIRTNYIEYNSVYSKQSNQFHYHQSGKEVTNPLKEPQEQLDSMIFDKQGYVFFPDKNKQEKGECSYCVEKDNEVKGAFESGTGLKVVYKLRDVEQYLNKNNNSQFDLEYQEVDCRNEKGETLTDKEGKIRKCTKLKDQLIKAKKTEVFFANKLCRLNLGDITKKVLKIIKTRLKNKNLPQSYTFSGDNHYTDDLSMYDSVEIEALGGGEDDHIEQIALSTKSRSEMPGDYIKAKLKIDTNYPIISIDAKQGGGNREQFVSDKNGGSTTIKICKSNKQDCKPLITVAGGGTTDKTIIHNQGLKLDVEQMITSDKLRLITRDNQITYIENAETKHKRIKCSNLSSNKTGAGGCIDKNSRNYSKGAPGYVTIRPIKIDDEELKKIINKIDNKGLETITNTLVENPNINDISNLIEKLHPDTIQKIKDQIKLIAKLYPNIINIIKEEIGKQLLGDQSEAI